MRDLIEEELRGPSVVRDPRRLGFDFVPEELPRREQEVRQLARLFRPLIEGAVAQHALVTGPVGVGKTAVAKRFCEDFARAAAKQDVHVESVHVNCRKHGTTSAALVHILRELRGEFPDRGFSVEEMLKSLQQRLEPKDTRLLVVLDEADWLLKRGGPDLVYLLTRFNEEKRLAHHGVSVILVSQADVRPLLDEASASTLKVTHHLRLEKYDAEALRAIAGQRVDLAFVPGAVEAEVVELVADIAAQQGSARRAIELLEGAGRAADSEHSRRVSAEHVRAAKADVESVVTDQKLRELEKHKRLALLAVARCLRDAVHVNTGKAEEAYRVVCEERGEEPRGHTQFWTYLKDLQAAGLLDAKRSGKGQAGMTTIIALHDIPARVLETRLEELLGR